MLAVGVLGVSLGWVLTRGLSGNLIYFMTPTELVARGSGAVGEQVRLGGQVAPSSDRAEDRGVRFILTDGTSRVTVLYSGAVPALFRPGIGVVVEGRYGLDGLFHADTLLIKHAEVYRPPAPGETPSFARLEAGP